jgi:hypothetical protein
MKRRSMLMFCQMMLTFFALPSMALAQFSPVSGLEDEKLSSRPSPAQITQESADALKNKGYVMIGQISVGEEGKRCWDNNCVASLDCARDMAQKDLSRELLKNAASKGGDLVALLNDKTINKGGITKKGKCLVKGPVTKSIPFQKCQSAYRDSVTGTYRTGSCTTEMKTITANVCTSWETVSGYGCSAYSSGTVWRLEPDMEKRIAANAFAKTASIAPKKYEKPSDLINAEAFTANSRLDPDAPMLIFENKKWSYIDRDGKIAIPLQFDYAEPFVEGLALVRIGSESGYIDKTGAFINKRKFIFSESFSEGLAAVGEGPGFLKYKYGYINLKGELVIPIQFERGSNFVNGEARVIIDGARAYIDMSGNVAAQSK